MNDKGAFPLHWPRGVPRTTKRTSSPFRVKPTSAYSEMMDELHRFGAKGIVVSTNIPLRIDGTPYRDGLDARFEDPGVAVYFTRGNRKVCLPCDTYLLPYENCRAIGLAIEGLRAMERHGARQILDQALESFIALPPPVAVPMIEGTGWWTVLGVSPNASADEINAAWREKCREHGEPTVELNEARETGLKARDAA